MGSKYFPLALVSFLFVFSGQITIAEDLTSTNSAHEQKDLSTEWIDTDSDDLYEQSGNEDFDFLGCKKATKAQVAEVQLGNTKKEKFLQDCANETQSSRWCQELTRPNPSSQSVFQCTYGSSLPHQLIHPNTKMWKNAFAAVRLVEELEDLGIQACQIYNWWRPEPYNQNVGGAAGRHPFGTSVDVRFCTMNDMEKAFKQLCRWRSSGRLRAVGYYGSTALHFGIGDSTANTWGKSCPSKLALSDSDF